MIQSFVVEAVIPEYLPVKQQLGRDGAIHQWYFHLASASQKVQTVRAEILSFLLNVYGESSILEVAGGEGNLPI